jgi:hypothetical protein
MHNFRDADGRAWNLEVTIPEVRRVRDRLHVEILEFVDVNGELFKRVTRDPCLLCDVLYVLCEPQAVAQNITDEQFGRALRGDALDGATDSLLWAIIDFFPSERREALRSLWEKVMRLGKMAHQNAMEILRSPQLETAMQKTLKNLLAAGPGESVSDSPESSASTPTVNQDLPSVTST